MTSPLTTVNPRSLEEIFNAAPGSLSEAELDSVVVELRRQRAKWQEAEASGKRVSAPKAVKKSKEELLNINLDDLGI
jgi:hypothetical protein